MLPRFLAVDLDPSSRTATLAADEAHHLTHVLRLGAGDEIAVFDGNGREYRARIERLTRDGALVQLLDAIDPTPEPTVRLTLAQGVLKGDKMQDVIRDATMMGVATVEPLISARTTVRLKTLAQGPAVERWRRIAVASAKQCRRAVVPVIGRGTTLEDLVARETTEMRLILVEPSAVLEGHPVGTVQGRRPASATLIVGPEGGWTAEEVDAAIRAGWMPITLGRRTLRADAVAIVAIGVLQYLWSDL
jgi:16S rRNA (uracil1498-N3)-methyltransferase